MARKKQILAHGDFQVEIEGFDELEKRLEQMGDVYEAVESLLESLQVGADILQAAAQETAPGEIYTQREVNSRRAKVGVGIGFSKKKWYYMFFETGAGGHEISPKSKRALMMADGSIVARVINHPGIPARPFLRPALDNRGDEAVRAISDSLWTKVEKLFKE